MKRIIYLICFCASALLLLKCKKAASIPAAANITGTWELSQRSGQTGTTNFSTGNGNLLKFTNTSYEIYTNGLLTKKGLYTTMADSTVRLNVCLVLPVDTYKIRIVYDNKYDTTKTFINISQTQLGVISGCFASDAGSGSQYNRQ